MWKYLKLTLVSLWAVFAPIQNTIEVVAALIICDLILGIIAALKRKEPITSAGFKRTIIKLFVFELALCLGFLAEHYITGSMPFVNLIGGFISLTETTSLMENLNEISGGTLLSSLISKLNLTKAE